MPRGRLTNNPNSNTPGRGLGGGRGGGRGRQPGGYGMGPGGYCICPQCKTRIEHKRGVPCYQEECPECGAAMVRDRNNN
ncbi:MAG: hypothetical protein ACOC1P_02250 [Minisyncoccales bacterium]